MIHYTQTLFEQQPIATTLAKVSFLRRKTNITQAPGQDTPRCVTLGGLYTAAERIQPAEQEQRPGEGVGVRCGVLSPFSHIFSYTVCDMLSVRSTVPSS